MFTNNMAKLMEMVFFADTYAESLSGFVNAEGSNCLGYCEYLCYAGIADAAKHLKASELTAYKSSGGPSAVSRGLYVGSGSTPATKADYKLESPITSGLSISGGGNTPVLEHTQDGIYSYSYAFSVQNTTESEINIYEFGLFVPICSYYHKDLTTTSSVAGHSIMVNREVLTEPITIAPGATKVVNYKLTFNHTLNVD